MGQGQSQQRTEAPPAEDNAATPASPPHSDQPLSADGNDHQAQREESAELQSVRELQVNEESAPAAEDDTTACSTLAHDGDDTFKVPSLPASAPTAHAVSPTSTLQALPTDIEHILSLGANEPDEAQLAALASGRGTSELEQVVRELRNKAFETEKSESGIMEDEGDERMTNDELEKVEVEMRLKGVTRVAEVSQLEAEEVQSVEAPTVPSGPDNDVQMQKSDSSDSDSDSDLSSSDSDGTTAAAPASRQRTRRGKQRADSDVEDDEESGIVSSKTAPKTEHEVVEPEVAAPPVEKIDDGAELAKFGKVESVIETVVVIKADTGGDWRVLDEGTVVCWEDRTVIGTIFETFGSVQQPFYSIRFPASAPPDPSVFTASRAVFYSPNLASFVFTRDLRNLKGSDASNIWDEEVGANEVEFSDDEEEAEYKKRQKADRKARNQSATPAPSGSRPSRPSSSAVAAPPPSGPPVHLPARPAVSYADTADDFLTPSVPSAAPMGTSNNRAMVGTKPPPGRVGRRMFERDTGAALGKGEEVEFEFSSGEGSDGEEDVASVAGSEGTAPAYTGRGGRGGRGGAAGAARGGQRGGGPNTRGRGRGRGGAANSPSGRPIAGMPRPRVASGSAPAGLPSKPSFDVDFAMTEGSTADGSNRMSDPSVGGSPNMNAPQSAAPYAFGAPPTGAFSFNAPSSGPSTTRSPPQPQPPAGQATPWSASSGAGIYPLPPPSSGPSAAYSPNYAAAPSGPRNDAGAFNYYPDTAASYWGLAMPAPFAGPSAFGYPAPSMNYAGGYSPYAPYASQQGPQQQQATGSGIAGEGYDPIAVQGGGHVNPRFFAEQQAAAQGQGQGGIPHQDYYQPHRPHGGQGDRRGGYGGGAGRWSR